MALRLTKTSKIVFAVSIGLLSIALGFLIWRVNQPDTVSPTDADAGGGAGACCTPSVGCVAGYECKDIACSDTEMPQTYYYGDICPSGQSDLRCRTGFTCREVGDSYYCDPVGMWTCVPQEDGEPPTEGDCKDTICEWPQVLMSGRIDPNEDVCRCETCTGVDPNDPYSCSGNPPTCSPSGCPSGYESCGTSANHESGDDCQKLDSSKCVTYHPDCNNPTYVFRYCKPIVTQSNVCDGGTWVAKPSGNINPDSDILFSATATDSNGIKEDSITARLCTGLVATCTTGSLITYTISESTATDSTFEGVLSNDTKRLEPGEYTLSLSWADSLGATSTSCALTTSFTVLAEELNPAWNITKSVTESCIDEETENPTSQLLYTITVTNTGEAAGSISKVEDVLDSKVLVSFIQSEITDPGEFSSGKIVWSYIDEPLVISSGSSKTYTYTLNVDKENFGTYNNQVTLVPVGSDSLTAEASIAADCIVTTTPEEPEENIPETGIFDSTLGRISVGFGLIALGAVLFNIPNRVFLLKEREVSYKYRERFERKVAKK